MIFKYSKRFRFAPSFNKFIFGMANYQIFSQAITCANAFKPAEMGGGGKCKDKYDEDKCIKMMEAGKCEDKKVEKKCMKTCEACEDGDGGGEGGKCKDKMDKKKCKKIMEAGKCEDEKVAKKCMKTCDMCEDMGPKKSTIPNLVSQSTNIYIFSN